MAKYTNEDIKRLANAMRRARDDSSRPFMMLTGAGCSIKAGIPLAPELVKEIHAKFGDECRRRLSADELDDYGKCMSCLTKNERRDLLKPYLDRVKTNWAHIAIAAMLKAGFVSRVLTFNFDSVLAKACGLMGLYPATYDFASAPTIVTDYISAPAIIHLHGQGFGQSMMNSEDETRDHANNLRPLVRDCLTQAPFLIIGYSGSSDAVFPMFEAEFEGRERLWWAGHDTDPAPHIRGLLDKGRNTTDFVGGVEADLFLVELAQILGCWPPKLFEDPYGHLLEELEPVADFPLGSGSDGDLLSTLRERLQKQREAQTESTEEAVREAFMKGDWDQVIARANAQDAKQLTMIAWAFVKQANYFSDTGRSKQNEGFYRQSFEKYARASEIKPDMREAFYNWGNALSDLAKLKQDEGLYRESFEKYARAVEIKPDSHEAFNNWGAALSDLAKLKQDEGLYRESFEKYARAVEIVPDKHEAFNNWGLALSDLAKLKEDEGLYRESFEKYTRAVEIKPDMHEAFYNWGNALSDLAELKEDEGLYRESFEKYARAVEIKPDSHGAFYNWGTALLHLAKLKEDEGPYRESFEKYARAVEIVPDKHEAFNNWGTALLRLAKLKEDEGLYRESFEKYARAVEIKPDSHEAFNNWGTALLQYWRLAKDDAALKEAREVLNRAEELNPEDAYNSACLDAATGDTEACHRRLERCKEKGTLPSKVHLLEDPDLESVRSLGWLKTLLADLPD